VRNTFVETLSELARDNSDIWLLCGDLGFSVLEKFAAEFPKQFVNIGVAEQNMAGIAAGLALSGKTVFIYSIGNFPTFRCLEQLRNDVCYHGADVKVVAVGAGFAYGAQGYTHHAIEDVAVMASLPDMEVLVPCDPLEVRLATRQIAASGKPSYLRLSRSGEPVLHPQPPQHLGPTCLREGGDIVVLGSGPIVSRCMAACRILNENGIAAGLYSVPRVKPLDEHAIQKLASTTRLVVTVEEHILRGGLYAAVAMCLADQANRPPVLGLGIPEGSHRLRAGDRDSLMDEVGLSPTALAESIRIWLEIEAAKSAADHRHRLLP
jgi:transketolase